MDFNIYKEIHLKVSHLQILNKFIKKSQRSTKLTDLSSYLFYQLVFFKLVVYYYMVTTIKEFKTNPELEIKNKIQDILKTNFSFFQKGVFLKLWKIEAILK